MECVASFLDASFIYSTYSVERRLFTRQSRRKHFFLTRQSTTIRERCCLTRQFRREQIIFPQSTVQKRLFFLTWKQVENVASLSDSLEENNNFVLTWQPVENVASLHDSPEEIICPYTWQPVENVASLHDRKQWTLFPYSTSSIKCRFFFDCPGDLSKTDEKEHVSSQGLSASKASFSFSRFMSFQTTSPQLSSSETLSVVSTSETALNMYISLAACGPSKMFAHKFRSS